MTLKIIQPRVDGVSPEEVRALLEMPAYMLVMTRIKEQLARASHTCCFAEAQLEVMRAQGAVMALETAIYTPERLLEQMMRA